MGGQAQYDRVAHAPGKRLHRGLLAACAVETVAFGYE
jgi:hypothetical protein